MLNLFDLKKIKGKEKQMYLVYESRTVFQRKKGDD